jgi:hypothetical protein
MMDDQWTYDGYVGSGVKQQARGSSDKTVDVGDRCI